MGELNQLQANSPLHQMPIKHAHLLPRGNRLQPLLTALLDSYGPNPMVLYHLKFT